MRTLTDRRGRTRVRVSPGTGLQRCMVRTTITQSEPSAPTIRPVIVRHDSRGALLSLMPEGALLLAGDAIEIDVTVDPGMTLELVEPGGTVAFDMHEGRASWDVSVRVGAGGALAWAGEPFVLSEGADVSRSTRIRYAADARIAVREMLVLGRSGEGPGTICQSSVVRTDSRPVLVEELAIDRHTASSLIGDNRVISSVLAVGVPRPEVAGCLDRRDRFDLAADTATLWRRLGRHVHETTLAEAWTPARAAALAAWPGAR